MFPAQQPAPGFGAKAVPGQHRPEIAHLGSGDPQGTAPVVQFQILLRVPGIDPVVQHHAGQGPVPVAGLHLTVADHRVIVHRGIIQQFPRQGAELLVFFFLIPAGQAAGAGNGARIDERVGRYLFDQFQPIYGIETGAAGFHPYPGKDHFLPGILESLFQQDDLGYALEGKPPLVAACRVGVALQIGNAYRDAAGVLMLQRRDEIRHLPFAHPLGRVLIGFFQGLADLLRGMVHFYLSLPSIKNDLPGRAFLGRAFFRIPLQGQQEHSRQDGPHPQPGAKGETLPQQGHAP